MKKFKFLPFVVLIVISLSACRQITEPRVDDGIRSAIILKVYSPTDAEVYSPGDKVAIRWNVLSKFNKVAIHLYKKTEYILTITPEQVNSGYFLWTIPPDINPSHHYKIKVENYYDPNQYSFSETFFILEE